MHSNTLIYIIIAGIIALLLALFQYIYKSKTKSSTNLLLAFLRFVSVFSILLLLINPKFESTQYYNEKPTLVVAVDNSESISHLKQSQNAQTITRQLKENERLNKAFNLEFFTFGNTVKHSDSLTFNEKQTNLALLFKRLSELYNQTNAPTLIVTDGNQTLGADYTFSAQGYKQPLFPFVLGDTTKPADLKIEQLNVNRYAFKNNRFPIETIVSYHGSEPISTVLRIKAGNTTVFSKKLSLSPQNTSSVVTLTLPANRVGVNTFKAEIEALPNEKNLENNIKNFAIEVIDQKTKIALVSSIVHPDLGALKKAIETNEQRQVNIISPKAFVESPESYQLAILYQPDLDFKSVFSTLDNLGLNSWVLTGTHTNWEALNSFQEHFKLNISNQTEEYQPLLNQGYSAFIVDDFNFNTYPPLKAEYGVITFTSPFETLFNKSVNGFEVQEPLLATSEVNNRRTALLLGEGLWRWRAQNYLDQSSFSKFDDFVGKLVQYLASNTKKTRLKVDYQSFYQSGESPIISAQYFNKNYEFDSDAALSINLTHKDTKSRTSLPLILRNTHYQVDLSTITPGAYQFVLKVANQPVAYSGEFTILNFNIEQQFLSAQIEKLQTIAKTSGGTCYFNTNIESLTSVLLTSNQFKPLQKSTKKIVPLIGLKYLLALIALSLAAEWFIRKYIGLI